MKAILLILILFSFACARKNEKECRTRESMTMECQVVQTPQYGRAYAQEECKRQYSVDKCY
jgi:hypothetical protein